MYITKQKHSMTEEKNVSFGVSFFFSNKLYSQCTAFSWLKCTTFHGSKINSMDINRRKKNWRGVWSLISSTNVFLFSSTEIKEFGGKNPSLNKLSQFYICLQRIFMYIPWPKVIKFLFLFLLYGFNRETRIENYFRKFSSNCSKCGRGEWWQFLFIACNLGLSTANV